MWKDKELLMQACSLHTCLGNIRQGLILKQALNWSVEGGKREAAPLVE